jgi:hypothetical protein
MNTHVVGRDRIAVLKRLIAETGTAEVLSLLADIARQHAEDLLKQGARVDAARFAKEAKILAKASQASVD